MRETRIGSSRRVSLYINKALSETMQLSIDLILKLKMQTASRRARNEVKAIFVFLFFRVLVFVFFLTIDMPRRKRFFFCAISRLKDWGCRLETFFSSIVIQSFRKAKKEFYLQRHFDRFPFFVPCGDKCHPMRDVICVYSAYLITSSSSHVNTNWKQNTFIDPGCFGYFHRHFDIQPRKQADDNYSDVHRWKKEEAIIESINKCKTKGPKRSVMSHKIFSADVANS